MKSYSTAFVLYCIVLYCIIANHIIYHGVLCPTIPYSLCCTAMLYHATNQLLQYVCITQHVRPIKYIIYYTSKYIYSILHVIYQSKCSTYTWYTFYISISYVYNILHVIYYGYNISGQIKIFH